MLRGRVLAPFGKLALHSPRPTSPSAPRSPFPGWLVTPAEAAPLEDERPVADATVRLFKVGATGDPVGEVLAQTQSNTVGEWCVRLPEGVEVGADLMLETSFDQPGSKGARLRRSVVADFSTDTYVGTEALTQLLQARRVDFTRIPTPTYLNMESVADSRMDLLTPVKLKHGVDVETAVGQILAALELDPRLQKKLESLSKIK